MRPSLRGPLLAAALVAAASTGCGLGEGEPSEGEATLTVTRDYGTEQIVEASQEDPAASETVIRFLDREAEITTRYGGGFVQSIEGISGTVKEGRSYDWFFFVDGIESPIGAADSEVRAGERIWWDYRDWTDAMRAPAVVGSWPEPFLQEAAGSARVPVRVECAGEGASCDEVAERLADERVDASVEPAQGVGSSSADALRVLVGTWEQIVDDPAAALLDDGPAASGVFARFMGPDASPELATLDERAAVAEELGSGAGLVAAVREGEEPPTWLVTGVDERGLDAAVELLDEEDLANRYAVAGRGDSVATLPVIDGTR